MAMRGSLYKRQFATILSINKTMDRGSAAGKLRLQLRNNEEQMDDLLLFFWMGCGEGSYP